MSYRIYYLKANDPNAPRAIWLRVMQAAGCVHRWAVLTELGAPPQIWQMSLPEGNGADSSGLLRSQLTGPGTLSWDLHWTDPGKPCRLLPAWTYSLPWPPSHYESLNWNAKISGTLQLSSPLGEDVRSTDRTGEGEWTIKNWPAQMGHIWGSGVASSWGWAHCSAFEEDPSATFEMITSPFPIGKTVLRLQWGDQQLWWNQPWHWWRARHQFKEWQWDWKVTVGEWRVEGSLTAPAMTYLHYPAPIERDCWNTKLGAAQIVVHHGLEKVLTLTTPHRMAWERVAKRSVRSLAIA